MQLSVMFSFSNDAICLCSSISVRLILKEPLGFLQSGSPSSRQINKAFSIASLFSMSQVKKYKSTSNIFHVRYTW